MGTKTLSARQRPRIKAAIRKAIKEKNASDLIWHFTHLVAEDILSDKDEEKTFKVSDMHPLFHALVQLEKTSVKQAEVEAKLAEADAKEEDAAKMEANEINDWLSDPDRSL